MAIGLHAALVLAFGEARLRLFECAALWHPLAAAADASGWMAGREKTDGRARHRHMTDNTVPQLIKIYRFSG